MTVEKIATIHDDAEIDISSFVLIWGAVIREASNIYRGIPRGPFLLWRTHDLAGKRGVIHSTPYSARDSRSGKLLSLIKILA